MRTSRTHVILPDDLIEEIDKLVGARHRSAFLADLVRRELERRRLLEIFASSEPIWKDEDHPELKDGSDAWVARLRAESDARIKDPE